MKAIIITQISHKYLKILQAELAVYYEFVKGIQVHHDYLNSVIQMAIVAKLLITLRNKIENDRRYYRHSFSLIEAATILKCNAHKPRDFIHLETVVMDQFKEKIIAQLQDLEFYKH